MVEGYLDVIALHQAGFHRVVAPLGTSVTAAHLALGFEHSDELVLCFDADGAGQGSESRTIALAYQYMKSHQHICVMRLPCSGTDPDEFVRDNGAAAFQQALDKRVSGAIALIEHHAIGVHRTSVGECARLAHVLTPAIEETMDEWHRIELVDAL